MADSVSGISRSGRVRKKSAKLMEMEDLESPEVDSELDPRNRKKVLKVMPVTSPPPLVGGDAENDANKKVAPIKIWSRPPGSLKQAGDGNGGNAAGMMVLTALPASGYISDHPSLAVSPEEKTPKKAKGKAEAAKPMSPLKVSVGDFPKPQDSVRDDSAGIRLKLILSPKEKSLSGETDHSSSECSPMKSPVAPPAKDKKKKKKQSKSSKKESSKTLESPSKGRSSEAPQPKSKSKKGNAKHGSSLSSPLRLGSSSDTFDSPDLGDGSDLIIAEPKPKPKPAKKKKSSGHHASGGSAKKSHETPKIKVKREPERLHNFYPDETSDADDILSNHTMLSSNSNTHSQSVCLTERKKGKKKKQSKVLQVNEKVKPKGRPMTAYMLWCREQRPKIVSEYPDMDFASISRRLGERWQCLHDKEKLSWRRKAKKLAAKASSNLINTSKSERGGKVISKQQKIIPSDIDTSTPLRDMYKVVGIAPIDVAAHLKLLGESLSIIGQRLTEHEGQIAVSGSLSVLLDSTLCALGPLLCLTAEVDETNGCSHDKLGTILDNIAYIVPGL